MSDNLRDRIAAVVEEHDPAYLPGGLDCNCGQGFRSDAQWAAAAVELRRFWSEHVADAVIRELGLRLDSTCHIHDREGKQRCIRYVTEWEVE